MGFLLPTAFGAAALALPIILLYMLKLRRQPTDVSSLMLWEKVLSDQRVNAPWQRLIRNMLLLLQLLILGLLVMALARPYFEVTASVQGNIILLLDASASMQAKDVAPNRFAAAQTEAINLIDQLGDGDAVTLILVAQTPQILASATTDHRQLQQLINRATVTNGPADWNAGLNLAAANTAANGSNLAEQDRSSESNSTIVIISDGAILDETGHISADTLSLPFMPAPVEFIPIGASANNQGLVALSLRDGAGSPHLYINVYNADEEPVRRLVEIQADGALFDARWVDLPSHGSASVTVDGLPQDVQAVQARLTNSGIANEGDDLAVDDVGWAIRSNRATRILLVSRGNLFLERALSLLPNITLLRSDPTQPLPRGEFDLFIFDRVDLTEVDLTEADFGNGEAARLDGNLFFIAPPATTPLFDVDPDPTQPAVTNRLVDDPLLDYVSLEQLKVGLAQSIAPPAWFRTLIGSAEVPLLMVGEENRRRVAILSFDLHQSNLPLQIDFPILIVNLARWLLPNAAPEQGEMYHVNDPLILPTAPGTDHLVIKTPPGDELRIASDQPTFEQTQSLGIYQIFAAAPADERLYLTQYAINLLNEAESNIKPRLMKSIDHPGTTLNRDSASDFGASNSGDRNSGDSALIDQWEWWWILVLIGLCLLLWEWQIYWQGRFTDELY